MNNIFDRYYKEYDAWYDRNKFVYLSELKALKKVLPKKGKGLEIGVGTGRFAAPLGITMGIDPSHNMIRIAEQRGVNVRWGFGKDLSFGDDVFDYVAIIITLCFVKEPLKTLREAYRILKQRGKIIIGIIDKNSFLGKFYQKKKSIFYRQAHFFSVEESTGLLRQTGFKKFSYHQTLFSLPKKIKEVEKPQEGFGKGGFVVICAQKKGGGK
ncbi:MAG: class I SAM-dependent methyltransferase [Candidatus Omnitrophota bacterium]|nr:class I SAM-dependent methyltransferase [Candidatus Omnitrophota bacterium]